MNMHQIRFERLEKFGPDGLLADRAWHGDFSLAPEVLYALALAESAIGTGKTLRSRPDEKTLEGNIELRQSRELLSMKLDTRYPWSPWIGVQDVEHPWPALAGKAPSMVEHFVSHQRDVGRQRRFADEPRYLGEI